MYQAASLANRLREQLGDTHLHSDDVDGVPLPRGAPGSKDTRPPLEEGTKQGQSVLSEVIEKDTPAVQPTSPPPFVPSTTGVSFPAPFNVGSQVEVTAAAQLARARGPSDTGGGGVKGLASTTTSRVGGSKGSLFKQRMAASGVHLHGADSGGGGGGGNTTTPPTFTLGSKGSLAPTTPESRIKLAQALGFASVEELDQMDANTDATIAGMDSMELTEAVSSARSVLGEAAFAMLLQRQGGGGGLSNPLPFAGSNPSPPLPLAKRVQIKPTPDLSTIRTHEELMEAAATYLPPSELKKLEWLGVLSGSGSGEALSTNGDGEGSVAIKLPGRSLGSGGDRPSASDYGAGSTQAIALIAAACESEEDRESGGGGSVPQSRAHALTTDTAVEQYRQLASLLGGGSSPASSSFTTSITPSPHGGGGGMTVTLPTDPPLQTLRFDLEGCLIRPASHLTPSALEVLHQSGLHHHGESEGEAGYTLVELLGLLRSSVEGQRRLALRALEGVLVRRRAAFTSPLAPPSYLPTPSSGVAHPWRYPLGSWAREAEGYRTLLLPPVLPILLRLSLDEPLPQTLQAALEAYHGFIIGGVEGSKGGAGGEPPECTAARALFEGGGSGTATELHTWCEPAPLIHRAQPPILREGEWVRYEEGVCLPTSSASSSSKSLPTASGALKDGALALSQPLLASRGSLSVIPRLAYILGQWFVGAGGLGGGVGGGEGGDPAALLVAVSALRCALPLVTYPTPTLTLTSLPRHSGKHTLGLLEWCAHAFLFTPSATIRGGEGGTASPSNSNTVLAALLVLRLIRSVLAQSRAAARDFCDSAGGLEGGGRGAHRPTFCSPLTIDSLLQFLPICPGDGTALGVLRAGGGVWKGTVQQQPSSIPSLTLLRLACSWEVLRIVRVCVGYGLGMDHVCTLWPVQLRGLVLPPFPTVPLSTTPQGGATFASAAVVFSAAVMDIVAGMASAAEITSFAPTPRALKPRRVNAVKFAQELGVVDKNEEEGGGDDEYEAHDEKGEEEVEEGDAVALGNQTTVMVAQCCFLDTPMNYPVPPTDPPSPLTLLLLGKTLGLCAAYFHPSPAGEEGRKRLTPVDIDVSTTLLPPPQVLNSSPLTAVAAAETLVSRLLAPSLPYLSLTDIATPEFVCAFYRACTAVAIRAPAVLGGFKNTLLTLALATIDRSDAAAKVVATLPTPLHSQAWTLPLFDSTSTARLFTTSPHPFCAARVHLHAATSASTLGSALGGWVGEESQSGMKALLSLASTALEVGCPGDEGVCVSLINSALFTPLPGEVGEVLQATLKAKAALGPLYSEVICGGGSGGGGYKGKMKHSLQRLHGSLPGLLPLGAPGSGGFPFDFTPMPSPPLTIGSPYPSSPLLSLLSILPRPLRPRLGLPQRYPSASSTPSPPLLFLPLAVDAGRSGALDKLLGEQGRLAMVELNGYCLEEMERGGEGVVIQPGGFPLFQHLLGMLSRRGGGGGGGVCSLVPALNQHHFAAATSALSSSLHTLLLLTHCGLVAGGEGGGMGGNPPLFSTPSAMLAVNSHCIAAEEALLRSSTSPTSTLPPVQFTPTALLPAHPRCGGTSTLGALARALGGVVSEEGPEAGATPLATAAALFLLAQRPLTLPVSGDGSVASMYSALNTLLLSTSEVEGEGQQQQQQQEPPLFVTALQAMAEGGVGHLLGFPCSESGEGVLGGSLLPPPHYLVKDSPTPPTHHLTLASALSLVLTPAVKAFAASAQGAQHLTQAVASWPGGGLIIHPSTSPTWKHRVAALPPTLQELLKEGSVVSSPTTQHQNTFSAYALAIATIGAHLWGEGFEWPLGHEVPAASPPLVLGWGRLNTLGVELEAAHPVVLSHIVGCGRGSE